MARPKKKRQQKKRGRIKFKQSAKLIHKNDATRVDRSGIDTIPRMQARPPADVAPTFRVKIRKKR